MILVKIVPVYRERRLVALPPFDSVSECVLLLEADERALYICAFRSLGFLQFLLYLL